MTGSKITRKPNLPIGILFLLVIAFFVSCNHGKTSNIADKLNDRSYHYHYISLDSTELFADSAMKYCAQYPDGIVEAKNNLAFVDIIRMKYKDAEKLLTEILSSTDNQFELLVANVQMMRLCQRESRNKEFYDYYWQAKQKIDRIDEDKDNLTPREILRYTYAKSEFSIVLSAYLYYVGQLEESQEALAQIDENGEIQKDTAQLLNYFYNVGSGGFFTKGTAEQISQKEFDYLVRCFILSRRVNMISWQANALQAMSEHLQDVDMRQQLIDANLPAMKYLNIENINDTLLAGNMAQRSVNMFTEYGDVYQTAGSLRTLSDCYFAIGDYIDAISCLDEALQRDTVINEAPALTTSIHEKLSINYSALDDKPNSDYYRNIYLDMHDNTRQDRELEARAAQLDKTSFQQNIMIAVVCSSIVLLILLLFIFTKMRRRKEKLLTVDTLMAPLETWKQRELKATEEIEDKHEEIIEDQQIAELMLEKNIQQNIEQRAKMSLVNSITPFIDRMLAEIDCLTNRKESDEIVAGRYAYILELTDKINEYNAILTDWIQLRKGELSLKIESFRLQDLFEMVKKSRTSFKMKGIELNIEDTDAVVKADRTLTLFMINTIADNSRKFTPEGGKVSVSAVDEADYVEIIVSDTGQGMDETELQNVFNHQPTILQNTDETVDISQKGSHHLQPQHGFGLMNCKGIIEKYKKVSQVFSVCSIFADSEVGKGTSFHFRLPHGILRTLLFLIVSLCSFAASAQTPETKVKMFADSTYFCNLQQRYEATLSYADSARTYLNICYRKLCPKGSDLMVIEGASADDAAELKWLSDSLNMDFKAILDVRNETAVAALVLHKWDLYNYNNKVYSRLYRECSADPSLAQNVAVMRQSSETKYVALVLLVIIFLCIVPAYYMLYYRYKVYYQFLIDRFGAINRVLLEDIPEEDKLEKIKSLWFESNRYSSTKSKEVVALNDMVNQICKALEESISVRRSSLDEIELAEDELHRLNYEIDRLHININVLDNCFSTLKHETMYYPSRIKQLVEEENRNLAALGEITVYYKELYMLLSLQAQHQVEKNLRIDTTITSYLLSLLRKLSGDKSLSIRKEPVDATYSKYIVGMPNLHLSEKEIVNMFTPLTFNLTCLVIRQIIREIGETTNHRGCGVQAVQGEKSGVDVIIILSNKINLNI